MEDSWIEQAATGPPLEPKHHVLRGGDHGEVGVLDLFEFEGLEDRLEGEYPGYLRVDDPPRAVTELLLQHYAEEPAGSSRLGCGGLLPVHRWLARWIMVSTPVN